jgi:hypothetical protein
MSVSYTCPNPDCGVTLKTPNRVATGKSVKCPKCGKPFVPEPEEAPDAAGPGTFKVAGDAPGKKPAKPGAKPEPAAGDPAAAAKKSPLADDDDEDDESVKKGYGVVKETEEEIEEANKNKPKFTEVQDKFKKSARGPALSLLVMPSNLLTLEGLITVVGGLAIFIVGMWPLVFNDAPPGEEEMEEAVMTMLLGVVTFMWGGLVCFGASRMQELGSYPWAMVGAVMGVLPLLVGIYGIIMLQNPKVKAGFEEAEAGPDEDDEDDDGDDDDEDETDEADDDDDDGGGGAKAKKRKKKGDDGDGTAKKAAKKVGRRLLKGILGGGDGGDE